MSRPLAIALAVLVLSWGTASAQLGGLFGGSDDKPLEIVADEGIEWQQSAKIYVARGNARATRGDVTVHADTLTAYYRDGAKGGTEIFRVVADGKVKVVSGERTVQGDRGVYEVDRGVVVMTGKDLRLSTGEDVVTARDSLEYWEQRQLAVARGDAVAIRDEKRVRADTLSATIGADQKGGQSVKRVDAFGNVLVSTGGDVARADTGVYNLERGVATLRGKVRITRGKNQLNGEYAVVDLNSGVSRLLPAPGRDGKPGRVVGLFVPKSDGAPDAATPPGAAPARPAATAPASQEAAPTLPGRKPAAPRSPR
ncbi:MAG: LptA/OstA family protein [Alphaproteobacteria bacterium]